MSDAVSPPDGDGSARLASLTHMIGRLSRPPDPGSSPGLRSLPGGAGALLDEVDATVMARRLLIRNQSGNELALEVRGRRLLWADIAGLPEGRADALGAGRGTLTYAGAGDLEAFAAALAAFCTDGGMTVRATPPVRESSLEETGVSVATLRHALAGIQTQFDDTPTLEGPLLQVFLERCAPLVRAWVARPAGGSVTGDGAEDILPGLGDILISAEDVLPIAQPGPHAIILQTAGGDALGVFADNDDRLAMVLDADDQEAVLSRWSGCLAMCGTGST
ncbi:hypothetical protein CLV78_101518 [Aliiruegeria haliotis]|uniref:Uncharacterized protein n=1 Tax=Aliiruegeria haliotis TaxID=1280846 RepID=A0A2T0RZF3_9RHOB|nr:hypothetical protein [Aliiruegeria haliotis]PRY26423.1 hypothetical protein CLV78_101518 [Aliiruegeria haliotis]